MHPETPETIKKERDAYRAAIIAFLRTADSEKKSKEWVLVNALGKKRLEYER